VEQNQRIIICKGRMRRSNQNEKVMGVIVKSGKKMEEG
jgi:hypothetical protein